MSEKVQQSGSSLDLVKWLVVAVLVAAGIYGYSHYADIFIVYRLLALLAVAGLAGWLAIQTVKGRAFFNLLMDARSEIRKVVWPTRQETVQTTVIVMIVVVIVALILWGVDSLLSWLINLIIG